MAFTAVATLADGTVMPFGPDFKSEDEGWRYLHSPECCAPFHKSMDILEWDVAIALYHSSLTRVEEGFPLSFDEIPF